MSSPIRVSSTKPFLPEYLSCSSLSHQWKNNSPLPLYCFRTESTSPEPLDLSLPTCWNAKDKSQFLELNPGNLRVWYQGICVHLGTGKTDLDAAAIRANRPISVQCGIYYFEVAVISKGRDGYIAIGFQAGSVALGRLPGWEDSSWGYHGDDGHSFCCSGTGKPYGPIFTTGDVVGCVINFVSNTVLFTKNGMLLGVAFSDFITPSKSGLPLFPAVGLRTPGEVVEVNFGSKPFKFDILQYYMVVKLM